MRIWYPLLPTNISTTYSINDQHAVITPFNPSPLTFHIYASVTWVSIGSRNGSRPVRRQAITWTDVALLSAGLLETNYSDMRNWI